MRRKFEFKWEDDLSIHVEPMDKDHQVLIKLMNDVYSLYSKNANRPDITNGMQALGNFVVEHFEREERFFATIPDYPDVDIHKAIHRKLIDRYSGYLKAYQSGGDLGEDFFFFLKAWLVAHIEGVDMRYGELASA